MSGVEVRAALAADVPQLAALGTEVFLATYGDTSNAADIGAHIDRHFSRRAVARERRRDGVEYLIAVGRGEPAGFLKLVSGPVPEPIAADAALEAQQVYVAAEWQRRGVGRRLMDAAVARAREQGADGIWLSVWTRAHWATRFYERYGFRSQAVVPFRIGSTVYDDFLMWLALDIG